MAPLSVSYRAMVCETAINNSEGSWKIVILRDEAADAGKIDETRISREAQH
jgi:hypothetical protein